MRLILITFLVMVLLLSSKNLLAQEDATTDSLSSDEKNEYSFETDIAKYRLKPPDTSSPRATLKGFIENMDRGYRILMEAHRVNIQSPGLFNAKPAQKMSQRAEELIKRSVYCLNLSKVKEDFQEKVGYEGALMLREILDRIELPPFEKVPDHKEIEKEEEEEKTVELDRWLVPNTGIVIAKVEEGPRMGEYLFTPQTVDRLEEYYTRVKDLPYKPDEFVLQDFYEFYSSTPGQLLPPKWDKWLPAWSSEAYFGQTIWQWSALLFLPIISLMAIWVLVRLWYKRSAERTPVVKFSGWVLIILITVLTVMLINYVLNEYVNISGSILVVVESLLKKFFIIFLAFIITWEVLKTSIKPREPDDEQEEDADDEWGARGLSRGDTLVLLLRKFLLLIVITTLGFLLLSAMGINIGPLLAGAGIVGIAIGFGSQKLISDVLSGIFFLIDDAFRVGEYIRAGSVSGTVEAITLRNVMLRHHRGMLQIVPYSELGSITNFMRGGLIVKFNIELPYDTDIEKVRKIIKKVGKKMLADPTLGPDFIKPVKSQGVRSVGDSVMVIRVKFTAQPGKHFVIRREAFRRITEALAAKGIYYAHRKVIVEMPESELQETGPEPAPNLKQPDSDDSPTVSPADARKDKILGGAAAGLETIINKETTDTPKDRN